MIKLIALFIGYTVITSFVVVLFGIACVLGYEAIKQSIHSISYTVFCCKGLKAIGLKLNIKIIFYFFTNSFSGAYRSERQLIFGMWYGAFNKESHLFRPGWVKEYHQENINNLIKRFNLKGKS